jgi:hypothetical protein
MAATITFPAVMQPSPPSSPENAPAPRKAGLFQVIKTIFFAFLMVGAKGTWEKDGTHVTPAQIVVAGLIGGILLVVGLILLARFVISMATG